MVQSCVESSWEQIEERVAPRRDSQLLPVETGERHSKQGQTARRPARVRSDWQQGQQKGRSSLWNRPLVCRSQEAIGRFICCSDFHLRFWSGTPHTQVARISILLPNIWHVCKQWFFTTSSFLFRLMVLMLSPCLLGPLFHHMFCVFPWVTLPGLSQAFPYL